MGRGSMCPPFSSFFSLSPPFFLTFQAPLFSTFFPPFSRFFLSLH